MHNFETRGRKEFPDFSAPDNVHQYAKSIDCSATFGGASIVVERDYSKVSLPLTLTADGYGGLVREGDHPEADINCPMFEFSKTRNPDQFARACGNCALATISH